MIKHIFMDVASMLGTLHFDNGCKRCPLLEKCKKADDEEREMLCVDVWYKWMLDNW